MRALALPVLAACWISASSFPAGATGRDLRTAHPLTPGPVTNTASVVVVVVWELLDITTTVAGREPSFRDKCCVSCARVSSALQLLITFTIILADCMSDIGMSRYVEHRP